MAEATNTPTIDIEALTRPFPPEAIKQRPLGSGANKRMVDYVEGHTVIHRLNSATGQCWNFRITQIERQGDLLTAIGELELPGLGTRTGMGVQRIYDKGGEDLAKGVITDALKKAATLFGVGLELYGPDYDDTIADAPVEREAAPGASNGSKAGSQSKTAPKKPEGEYPASYRVLKTTGDSATDAISIMERVEAAENLRALIPIITNARALKVLEDSDVSGAIVLKLTDAMEKIGNKDVLKSIDAVASSAGVNGLGVYRDTYKATIERLQKES